MRTNTSWPQDAGKIFRKTARLDLVRPSRPSKHLCTCNVTTPRRDGKTAKMEVNELLGRFENVENEYMEQNIVFTVCISQTYLLNLHIMAIIKQMRQINRLKVVLAEQRKTGKWLAQALGKNESTVSRWCTNEVQPSVETLLVIAETLKIVIKELFCSTQIDNKNENIEI